MKNNSKYDALNIGLIWPDNKALYALTFDEHTHLRGFDSLEKEFVVTNPVKREIALYMYDEVLTLPSELKWAQFAISYKNEKGKTFYTRLTFENGKPAINTFHWFRPQLKKSN